MITHATLHKQNTELHGLHTTDLLYCMAAPADYTEGGFAVQTE